MPNGDSSPNGWCVADKSSSVVETASFIFTVSQALRWAFGYYMPSADNAKDGVYVENAGAIFFLLLNHTQSYPCCYQ